MALRAYAQGYAASGARLITQRGIWVYVSPTGILTYGMDMAIRYPYWRRVLRGPAFSLAGVLVFAEGSAVGFRALNRFISLFEAFLTGRRSILRPVLFCYDPLPAALARPS